MVIPIIVIYILAQIMIPDLFCFKYNIKMSGKQKPKQKERLVIVLKKILMSAQI